MDFKINSRPCDCGENLIGGYEARTMKGLSTLSGLAIRQAVTRWRCELLWHETNGGFSPVLAIDGPWYICELISVIYFLSASHPLIFI